LEIGSVNKDPREDEKKFASSSSYKKKIAA
jgi:hypothetical protein